jgi:hypothetical protein
MNHFDTIVTPVVMYVLAKVTKVSRVWFTKLGYVHRHEYLSV